MSKGRQTKKLTKKQIAKRKQMRIEFSALFLIVVIILAALGEFGLTMIVGDILVFGFAYLFGLLRFVMYPLLIYILIQVFRNKELPPLDMKFLGAVLIFLSLGILLSFIHYYEIDGIAEVMSVYGQNVTFQGNLFLSDGGVIGVLLFAIFKTYTGIVGAISISLFLIIIGIALYLRTTLNEMISTTQTTISDSFENLQKRKTEVYDVEAFYDDDEVEQLEAIDFEDEVGDDEFPQMPEDHYLDWDLINEDEPSNLPEPSEDPIFYDYLEDVHDEDFHQPALLLDDVETSDSQTQVKKQVAKNYKIPSLNLLNPVSNARQNTNRSQQQAQLQMTLESFGINAKVTNVHVGPAVTQYEITLAPGVKVNRIVNLQNDIALALAAKGVRIEAPIPGKPAVGIEVPNESVQLVGLKSVLLPVQRDLSKKLLVGLGKGINGEAVNIELNKMPHLLVAGSTGSGKSVCINSIITSILLRATPDEVKFLMVDPKKVELNVYNNIPHLMSPVVTDAKKAATALKTIVIEMEARYEQFADAGVRNMDGYNEYLFAKGEQTLPYIVVIIDELADLMVVAAKEVEESIMRLAQMARAAGIHMIVATQRPSVDVITGVIKSNIPSRIAFAVSSQVDSRTILDMGGAERLVGQGDMLFLDAGENKPVRVQGAYVSETEIEKIVDNVKEQQEVEYDETFTAEALTEATVDLFDPVDNDVDELFEEAVAFAISVEMISASKLQRRFRLGYNRAARIIDDMVDRGLLGPAAGNKGRPVLIKDIEDIEGIDNEYVIDPTNLVE